MKKEILLLFLLLYSGICKSQNTQPTLLTEETKKYMMKSLLKNLNVTWLINSKDSWENNVLNFGNGNNYETETLNSITFDNGVIPEMTIRQCELSYPDKEYILYEVEIPSCRFNDSLANSFIKILSTGKIKKGLFPYYGKYLIAANKSMELKFINSTSMMLLDRIADDFVANDADPKKIQWFLEIYFYFSLKNISYVKSEKGWYLYKCYNEVLKQEDSILINPKNPYQKMWGKL